MEIVISVNKKQSVIKFDKNVIFFGKNSDYKNKVIKSLINGLTGKSKNILVDSKNFNYKDFNIINIDEENDFSNEFKFTKNNTLKQIIYNDIMNKIDEEKIIKYTNEIFDVIDSKVNNLLNKKVNKTNENNLSFQIEIPDINSIIDKFTNIYIDNILLNDSEISKSTKRKLLYQLYFLDIKKMATEPTIVIINNFDAYLSACEIIDILDSINNLSDDNCHFILSACSNIFEYLNLENYAIYKITDRLISFNNINDAIKIYLLKNEFNKLFTNDSFDSFYLENESLITDAEILNIKNSIIDKYSNIIGKMLNSDNIKIVTERPKNITCEYIVCDNKNMQNLFLEMYNKFID